LDFIKKLIVLRNHNAPKMKKTFQLLTCIVCLTSCKKIYTCECNTTYTYLQVDNTYKTEVYPGSNTAYSEKMKKKQAESACAHEQNAIETNFTNGVTSEGTVPFKKGESVSTSCELH